MITNFLIEENEIYKKALNSIKELGKQPSYKFKNVAMKAVQIADRALNEGKEKGDNI